MDNAVFALPIKNYSNPISRVRKIDAFKARARRQKANRKGTLAEGIGLVILHRVNFTHLSYTLRSTLL